MNITRSPIHFFASFTLGYLFLAGCSRQPQVTVSNHSSEVLTSVVVSGSGFSQALGTIAPSGTASASVKPAAESSLRLEFDAGGKHFEAAPDCYFENSPSYRVNAIVAPDFSVKVDVSMKHF